MFSLAPSAVSNSLRFRIWPNAEVGLSLVGKKQGAGWAPQQEDLAFAEQPGADMRPYDRLIGAALSGERWLFARQETVEAAWRVVDPVLGNVVPVHSYAARQLGAQGSRRPAARPRALARPGGLSTLSAPRAGTGTCA